MGAFHGQTQGENGTGKKSIHVIITEIIYKAKPRLDHCLERFYPFKMIWSADVVL